MSRSLQREVETIGVTNSTEKTRAQTLPQEDLALIQRVAARDRQAFETLYYRYSPRIGNFLLKLLKKTDLVEEVLNDVMLVVWQKARDFDIDRRLSTWLFGIAQKKAFKALAQTSRKTLDLPKNDFSTNASYDLNELPGPDDTEQTVSSWESHRILVQTLDFLATEQRAVIELAFFEGCTYKEIAEITNCPLNTVKTRMFSARRRLVQVLEELETKHLYKIIEKVL